VQPFDDKVATIHTELAAYAAAGKRLFATSSFQSNSVVLLHLLSELAPQVPVYFLDTGYHFPETLRFKRALAQRFGLVIHDLRSPLCRSQQRDAQGRLLFASDPDHCCHLNKIVPLDPIIAGHDVWVSGVRGAQSASRAAMTREATGRGGITRYHPLLDWDGRTVHQYITAHELPAHPLEDRGYISVGCRPCTRTALEQLDLDDRGGRWFGLNKTECGLHTEVSS